MTSKEKKELTIAVSLMIITALYLGFNFFGGSIFQGSSTPASSPTTTASSITAYLPNNDSPTIDLTPIQNSVFTGLIKPVYPQVTPSDLGGVNDPFIPLSAASK
jgi:hypothetical protein